MFDFDDPVGFHRALDALLADAALRQALGRAARAHVEACCSLDRVASSYLSLYREVAARRSPPPIPGDSCGETA
jgi:glycosyltransferase involved in cell wall biosynthesis